MTTLATDSQACVAQAIQKVTQIATLPEITAKIIQVVEDPKSSVKDLHEIIKHDVALSAKILKVVNSAFYALPRQVGSVDRAIVLLGLSTVKNIAIATSITKLFRGQRLATKYSPKDLWAHSLATGVFCKLIAEARGFENPDEIFVAGLMHDIGIVVEMQVFSNQLCELIDSASEKGTALCEAEIAALQADRQAFGAGLSVKWKFPSMFQLATGYHHEPMKASAPGQIVAAMVHVAEVMACHKEIGFCLEGTDVQEEALELVELPDERLEELLGAFDEKYAAVESVMN